jgi:hypothetical protein
LVYLVCYIIQPRFENGIFFVLAVVADVYF